MTSIYQRALGSDFSNLHPQIQRRFALTAQLGLAAIGVAEICEWFDDERECFCIEVSASNRIWGDLFGYSGSFKVEWRPTPANYVPEAILPMRVESARNSEEVLTRRAATQAAILSRGPTARSSSSKGQ